MERLGTVLELMQGARRRYTSLQATVRTWSRPDLAARAHAREMARMPAGSVAVLTARGALEEPAIIDVAQQPDEDVARILVESSTRWRVESDEPVRQVQVRDGKRCWIRSGDPLSPGRWREDRTLAYEVPPLEHVWDPALLIPELWIEAPAGHTTVAGRDGIRVPARPRPTRRPSGEHFIALPLEGDECELVVDAERGIALRLKIRLGGEPARIDEVVDVSFDGPIPPETFEGPQTQERARG